MGIDVKSRLRGRRRLPDTLPIFPMSSVLLLPGCRLPLNIFEPRYLQMVEDTLLGDRMIGVIQPVDPLSEDYEPAVQPVGCAGRIASAKATDDGRFLINLVGVSRFEVTAELANDRLYRMVEARWDRFREDLRQEPESRIDREELVAHLRAYFETRGLEANWRAIDESGNEELVNSLAMVCPFEPSEKQALLEASDLMERGRLVIALMNMAVLHRDDASQRLH